MNYFIYVMESNNTYIPVLTNDNVYGGVTCLYDHINNFTKLQRYIKTCPNLPQDGYYIKTTRRMVDKYTFNLNSAINNVDYGLIVDRNDEIHLVEIKEDYDDTNDEGYEVSMDECIDEYTDDYCDDIDEGVGVYDEESMDDSMDRYRGDYHWEDDDILEENDEEMYYKTHLN